MSRQRHQSLLALHPQRRPHCRLFRHLRHRHPHPHQSQCCLRQRQRSPSCLRRHCHCRSPLPIQLSTSLQRRWCCRQAYPNSPSQIHWNRDQMCMRQSSTQTRMPVIPTCATALTSKLADIDSEIAHDSTSQSSSSALTRTYQPTLRKSCTMPNLLPREMSVVCRNDLESLRSLNPDQSGVSTRDGYYRTLGCSHRAQSLPNYVLGTAPSSKSAYSGTQTPELRGSAPSFKSAYSGTQTPEHRVPGLQRSLDTGSVVSQMGRPVARH